MTGKEAMRGPRDSTVHQTAMKAIFLIGKSNILSKLLLVVGIMAILGMLFSQSLQEYLPTYHGYKDMPLKKSNDPAILNIIRKKTKSFPPLNLSLNMANKPGITTKPISVTHKPGITTKPISVTNKPVIIKNPINMTAKPVITTKPINVTNKPGITTKPINVTNKPGITTKPISVTHKPGITTKSINVTHKPGITTKPINVTAKPVITTKPINVTNKPGITTKPINVTNKPGITTKPISVTNKPGITTKPISVTHKPGITTKPINVTAKPVITTKSISVTHKPVITTESINLTAKPAITTKPINVTHKPAITTKPINVTHKPGITTKPINVTNKPVITTKSINVTNKPVITTKSINVTTKPVITAKNINVTNKPGITTKPINVTKKPVITTKSINVTNTPVITKKSINVTAKPVIARKPINLTAKLVFSRKPINLTAKTVTSRKPINVTVKPVIIRKPINVAIKPANTTKSKNTTSKSIVNTNSSKVSKPLLTVTATSIKEANKISDVLVKPSNRTQSLAKASVKNNNNQKSPGETKKILNQTRTMTRTPKMKPQTSTLDSFELGDTYSTGDDTYLHSTCQNRARDKFRTSEFKDTFLESIPIFQWKKHATEAEYKRLMKYWGTYGWGGLTWEVLNETLNLLNSSDNGYLFNQWKGERPCIRCAVVGNGGILNGSGMGKEIDEHDYVFRVNGAILKGFEKDVGNRTSFYFFTMNTMRNSLVAYGAQGFRKIPRTEETRYLLLPDHDRDYLMVRAALMKSPVDRGAEKNINPENFFGKNLTTEHFRILHPDFMRYLRNRFLWSPILNTRYRSIYRPTTGAAMLLTALHTCDEVNAYGFMTPNYTKFSDHYYDKIYHKVIFYANHSFQKEMELWQKLHKAGIIKLYMRN